MFVKVPCDYIDEYYSGLSGKPPEHNNCPKCSNTGYMRISLEEAREELDDLFEQRKELDEEIKALEKVIENALP